MTKYLLSNGEVALFLIKYENNPYRPRVVTRIFPPILTPHTEWVALEMLRKFAGFGIV